MDVLVQSHDRFFPDPMEKPIKNPTIPWIGTRYQIYHGSVMGMNVFSWGTDWSLIGRIFCPRPGEVEVSFWDKLFAARKVSMRIFMVSM